MVDVSMVKKLQDFTGPICLILGILLTFIGSKFIIVTISVLIFLAIVVTVFIAAVNFHIV